MARSQSATHAAQFSRVVGADVACVEQELVRPLILSAGRIDRVTEARVRVVVQTPAGEAEGLGSIYLSDLWSWPDAALSHEQRDMALRQLCASLAAGIQKLVGSEPAHPLELGLRLHDAVCHPGVVDVPGYDVPVLARAMCLSPFDAAIHDGVGRALGVCALHLYDPAAAFTSAADRWMTSPTTCHAIAAMLNGSPRDRLPAWLIVGKDDDMERDIRPWYAAQGYRCFKLKLHGRDVAEDMARTIEVARVARGWGCEPRISVDTNEACRDSAFVLEYLQGLRRDDPDAFARLEYLEQPTARDIAAHPSDWRSVTQLKPVLLDEGLTSLDLLPVAAEQGWSGLALKTCKGHSFALVAAAWAHERGLPIALQDLTNPGVSAIHAALLGAYLPTINGVELNSPQFTPAANAPYRGDWPGLFDVRDGYHKVDHLAPLGLGAVLQPGNAS